MATIEDVQKKIGNEFKTLKLLEKDTPRIYERKVGVTLSNLLHFFFDSYSTSTQNISVTTLKINVIIQKHSFYFLSTCNSQRIILSSPKINRKCYCK